MNSIKDKLVKKIKSWKPVGRKKHKELGKRYENLIEESNNLINLAENAKENHDQELAELRAELARSGRTGGDIPQSNEKTIHDLEAENYLLREVNEVLIKEKAELEKMIASLETDKQQQKEEFEKKLVQSQRSIESIEHRLVDCCDKCLAEEEETKENLNKAKKNFFELCEGLGVELSSQLKKDVEKSNTYKELLNNLSKVHNEKMIEINQKTSEEEVMPAETNQTEVSNSSSQPETNPSVKYFLWITGILALISLILFIIKKGKLRIFKTGKK